MQAFSLTPDSIAPTQERAAVALASGMTQEDAAAIARVSARQIRRWIGQPQFRNLVTSYQARFIYEIERKLAESGTTAVEVLRDLMENGSDSIRLGAARTLLGLSLRFREEANSERRAAFIEQITAEIAAQYEKDQA